MRTREKSASSRFRLVSPSWCAPISLEYSKNIGSVRALLGACVSVYEPSDEVEAENMRFEPIAGTGEGDTESTIIISSLSNCMSIELRALESFVATDEA